MKKKLNRQDYMFDKRIGEELIKLPGSINGLDFVVQYCEDSTIWICDHTAQVFVDACKNCKVYFGPVNGSLFVRQCQNVEVSSASGQFRVSNSKDIKCYIYSQSDPALEKSTGITFAPYNFSYPGVIEHFASAKLLTMNDKWCEVFDFTPNTEVRNWTIMNPQDYKQVVKELEEFPNNEIHPVPIPTIFGGESNAKLIIGSRDQEQSNEGFEFLMSKANVANLEATLRDQANNESDDPEEHNPYQQTGVGDLIQDNVSYQSNQAQQNMQSAVAFSLPDFEMELNKQDYTKQEFTQNSKFAQQFNENQDSDLNKLIREREHYERTQKIEKIKAAKLYLQNFMKEHNEQLQLRRQNNRAAQQTKQTTGNTPTVNPWQLILQNIKIKDNTGDKDVTQMQNAIINKCK